jgi:hypothetical protein
MAFVQQGVHQASEANGIIAMDGADWNLETPHAVTEGEIRAMYAHYRKVMEL